MTLTQQEALARVVHYLANSERRDYLDTPAEEQGHHIYRSVPVLWSLLEEEQAKSDEAAR